MTTYLESNRSHSIVKIYRIEQSTSALCRSQMRNQNFSIRLWFTFRKLFSASQHMNHSSQIFIRFQFSCRVEGLFPFIELRLQIAKVFWSNAYSFDDLALPAWRWKQCKAELNCGGCSIIGDIGIDKFNSFIERMKQISSVFCVSFLSSFTRFDKKVASWKINFAMTNFEHFDCFQCMEMFRTRRSFWCRK